MARRSDKSDKAIMINVKWELDGRELGVRGKTLGKMSEAGGVAHRWFYNVFLPGT